MGNQPNNAFPAVLDFFPLKITYFQDMSWPRATLQCYMVDHHKEINLVNPEGNQSWIFIGRTGAETETSVLWPPDAKNWLIGKDPEMGKIEGRRAGDDRGWDGWMAPPTGWTWVWASSRSWWWTGEPGLLQSMGSQRVGHDWSTKPMNWTEIIILNNEKNQYN